MTNFKLEVNKNLLFSECNFKGCKTRDVFKLSIIDTSQNSVYSFTFCKKHLQLFKDFINSNLNKQDGFKLEKSNNNIDHCYLCNNKADYILSCERDYSQKSFYLCEKHFNDLKLFVNSKVV